MLNESFSFAQTYDTNGEMSQNEFVPLPKLMKWFFLILVLVMIFITPQPELLEYFALGWVITSILFKALAGRLSKKVFRLCDFIFEGSSLSHISTQLTPSRVTFPSISTLTPGAFCKASLVVPLWIAGSSSTLYNVFSPSIEKSGRFSTISTPPNIVEEGFKRMFSKSVLPLISTFRHKLW